MRGTYLRVWFRVAGWGVWGLPLGVVLGVALLLTSCTSVPTADRSEAGGGWRADSYADASDVTIVRNVDDVPNVAIFCAAGERFAATLSVDGTRAPALVHLGRCGG